MVRGILAVLTLLLLVPPVSGGTIKKLSPAALAQESDAIVIGRVVSVATVLIHGEPWTKATITTEEFIKGRSRPVIYVRVPGGVRKVNGKTLITEIEGVPSFQIHQRTLVFVKRSDTESWDLAGFHQGYWRIENRQGIDVVTQSTDETASAIPLKTFLQEIRNAIKEQKRKQ